MKPFLKKIDWYIIRKFIGTYFFALMLVIVIFIIFDISEKISDFVNKNAPLNKIIMEYYLTFIPFFLNTFSSLFVFISVIFFTSKMAYDTEIIAILSSGVSFSRMLRPYFVSASFIFLLSLTLNHLVIPPATKIRLAFEDVYIKNPYQSNAQNLHLQIEPGNYLYMSNFHGASNTAMNFSLESFDGTKLRSKLIAENAVWDTASRQWRLNNYYIRTLHEKSETIVSGSTLDTTVNFSVEEIKRRENAIMSMDYYELDDYIRDQKMRGLQSERALLEKYNRTSIPFSVFVLTLIGVSLSSRKVRGGIGLQLFVGIALSFSYILLLRFSEMFIQIGIATPLTAAWIPNILFSIIAGILYYNAPK